MNEQAINEAYIRVQLLVNNKRLKEALIQLESLLWQCTDWHLRNRLEQVQTSYQYMLQYMQQGVTDPERKKLYTKLQAEILEIADQAQLMQLDSASPHYYHECRRRQKAESAENSTPVLMHILESFNDDLAVSGLLSDNHMDEVLARHEAALKSIFVQTWTNSAWTPQQEADAKAMLDSELLPTNDLCLFASAVTLSLMQCFDIRKMMWLMDAYVRAHVSASQRALVGLTFMLHIYRERLDFYPEISNRIELMNETLPLAEDLTRIQQQILLAQDTEAIDKKMREEIIPEMLKNVSSMRDMRLGIEDSDDEKDDVNPDWSSIFEQSGLGDKLREMNELQMEGADVYMSTFSALKGAPFFRELQNWFFPFDKRHSSTIKGSKQESEKSSIMELILGSGFFCNSDKYSLFFIMQSFPKSQRDMVFSQLTDQQMNDFAEQSKADTLKKFSDRPTTVSNQYLQDLYRFFKLNQRRHEFRNIFKEKVRLFDIPALQGVTGDANLLLSLADFQLKKKHWPETEELYQIVESMDTDFNSDDSFYQRMGYAQQKQKKYEEAIDSYLTADLLKPDNVWTNRHLATCFRMNREFDKALTFYRKVETTAPNNTTIIFYIGSCLVELQQYEEALNEFFKLDFLENNSLKAWRGIAWCSFLIGKYEQAMKHYDKVLTNKPSLADHLNAGHVSWVLGNREKAIALYSKAAEQSESRDAFLEIFNKDKAFLTGQGVAEDDIPLILDVV